MTTVYDKVKECCEEQNISIRSLEMTVGIGNGAIKHWETGSPTLKAIRKVADYFGKPVDYFISDE